MQLPVALRHAIEAAASRIAPNALKQAAGALSQRYQSGKPAGGRFVQNEAERCAYAAMRMPATYAAAHQVFSELQRLSPDTQFNSLLDLGAGTGAASWAATEIYGEICQVTLLEQDSALIRLGQELAQASNTTALRAAHWQRVNLLQVHAWPAHELAVCSYALGEIEPAMAARIVRGVWQFTQQVLIIIEPGTMSGFTTVRMLRDLLIQSGGHLVAPCPHAHACPLPETDWCHFAARVERSALQRRLKVGTLGYEDEKFSYVIFAKQPIPQVSSRVLRHPQRQPGYAKLHLCSSEGTQQITVTKRDPTTWKRVRKIAWGDGWE